MILVACGGIPIDGGDAGLGGGAPAGGGAGGGSAGSGGGSSTGGGSAAGGGQGGGSAGSFCKPCVESSDCDPGAMCLGYPGHCGSDCSQGQACAAGSTCDPVQLGKAPAGTQCTPTVDACGSLETRPDGLVCTDTWASFGDAFFANNCRMCHGGWPSSPDDATGSAQNIRLVIETHEMPPAFAATALADADRLRLLTWLECGATPSVSAPTGPVAH